MKNGFTLAEVLITLGIIGVVAALTMPTLIQNHRKHEVETKLAKFYSVINQAIRLAEVDYGDKMYWEKWTECYDENASINYFNKYFAPYLKTTKIDTVPLDEGFEGVRAYFADGSLAVFNPRGSFYFINANDLKLGFEEWIKLGGKRVFTFHFNPWTTLSYNRFLYGKGFEPYKSSWNGTEDMLRNNPTIGCVENPTQDRAYCAALIQLNGWKIPKDYPIKL